MAGIAQLYHACAILTPQLFDLVALFGTIYRKMVESSDARILCLKEFCRHWTPHSQTISQPAETSAVPVIA